jgi:hypothetical protein
LNFRTFCSLATLFLARACALLERMANLKSGSIDLGKIMDLLAENGLNYFYIMHLSYNGEESERLWDYARQNKCIGLDVPGIVRDNWTKVREEAKRGLAPVWIGQFDAFCRMHKGDLVLVLKGQESLLGVARIDDLTHKYDKELSRKKKFFDHYRTVQWRQAYTYANAKKLSETLIFTNTLAKVTRQSPRWKMLTNTYI